MPRHTPADRRAILEHWRRSGLSAADFAPTCGVSPATLYAWRRRRQAPVRFVEIVEPRIASASPSSRPSREVEGMEAGIRIEFGADGSRSITIRLACDFDAAALRRAVAALAEPIDRITADPRHGAVS